MSRDRNTAGAEAVARTTGALPTERPHSLSDTTRLLVRITAIPFALVGAVLFLAPGWASVNFLWELTPFVTMTMGAWYLGTAAIAWEVARVWRWPVVYASVLFLWGFGIGSFVVLSWHIDQLRPGAVLGWPYLLTVALGAVTAVYGIIDWLRVRPRFGGESRPMTLPLRTLAAVFEVEAVVIAGCALAGIGGDGRQVFPELLSLLTLNALGMFYLAVAVAFLPLLLERRILPALFFARAGILLVLLITIAAFVHVGLFEFREHPLGLVYLGTYVVFGGVGALYIWRYRSYSRTAERMA